MPPSQLPPLLPGASAPGYSMHTLLEERSRSGAGSSAADRSQSRPQTATASVKPSGSAWTTMKRVYDDPSSLGDIESLRRGEHSPCAEEAPAPSVLPQPAQKC
eukprot:scaffold5277_cov134-Pinguiococcus_pyrenoidosus.AAC.1